MRSNVDSPTNVAPDAAPVPSEVTGGTQHPRHKGGRGGKGKGKGAKAAGKGGRGGPRGAPPILDHSDEANARRKAKVQARLDAFVATAAAADDGDGDPSIKFPANLNS